MKITPVGYALIGAIAYLSFHAVAGSQGLSQWGKLQDNIKSLEEKRLGLLVDKQELQQQIIRLTPETLDDDYVEELARQRLHYVYPSELVLEPPELAPQLTENEELFALSN